MGGSTPPTTKSLVLPIYKGKGDRMECGSYRGIKLLEHATKVAERIFEYRVRRWIETDGMRFGFVEGEGTTDAVFVTGRMRQNFRVKSK